MAKNTHTFKYVGDPNDRFSGPHVITQYGVTWNKGEAVQVEFDDSEKDKENLARLRGNSHFVDMSDKDERADIEARQKAIEKAEADKAKAAEEQRKRDEADEKQRQKNLEKAGPGPSPASTAPRPPGTVTREPVTDAFGGRPVEERTQAEDHTKAGKTKS